MALEILAFSVLGILIGILFGLIPGLHPNFLIILSPFLFSITGGSENMVIFVVSMAISNAISDFIPSILLGAPEEGTELSVAPGHRMLLRGLGYQAVKLAVIGGFLSVILICLIFPLVILLFPVIYNLLSPFLFFLLVAISIYMVMTEPNHKKFTALLCFLLAGLLGISLNSLPIDSSLALFPILSGLFGASMLLTQFRQKIAKIPACKKEEYVSHRLLNRSVAFGTLGGIFAGLLPGVGTSQIASLATIDKNEKSFLITLGSLATSNILVSLLSLYMIGKARSGLAVILGNYITLSFSDVMLIIFAALFSVSISAIITLKLAKKFLKMIEKINYITLSKSIFLLITSAVIVFTGFYGLLLFIICVSLGLYTYLSKIRMSTLMGVLILPTIIFYFPFSF